MPSHGQKEKEKSSDLQEIGKTGTETRGLDGTSSARKERGDKIRQIGIPASDTTCPNEQLLSLQSSIEKGFTTMSGFLTKAIENCFSTMVEKFESNLLEIEDLDLELSKTEQWADKEKSGSPRTLILCLRKGERPPMNNREKPLMKTPNALCLTALNKTSKQMTSGTRLTMSSRALLTKGMADDKLEEKMKRVALPQNCEALTKVKVIQLVWNNLSTNVRTQHLRMQKLQTSLIKGITSVVLTTNKILPRLDSISEGKDLI